MLNQTHRTNEAEEQAFHKQTYRYLVILITLLLVVIVTKTLIHCRNSFGSDIIGATPASKPIPFASLKGVRSITTPASLASLVPRPPMPPLRSNSSSINWDINLMPIFDLNEEDDEKGQSPL
ncbi:hypothetical protein NL676_001248 [Syzygium grande]|nr:hypothetical protein NL676_001248 [Syzygium grande]